MATEQLEMFTQQIGLSGIRELPAINRNVVMIANEAKQTSVIAALRALPKTGTKRMLVFNYLRSRASTDEEIEQALNISGNTIRPIRGSLVRDGFVRDSNMRRLTVAGNEAIVWQIA